MIYIFLSYLILFSNSMVTVMVTIEYPLIISFQVIQNSLIKVNLLYGDSRCFLFSFFFCSSFVAGGNSNGNGNNHDHDGDDGDDDHDRIFICWITSDDSK